MHNRLIQRFFYTLLFALFGISVTLFIMQAIDYREEIWSLYGKIYLTGVIIYTWFIFILLFKYDFKSKRYPRYNNEKIVVIIPCYNEEPLLLYKSIKSVVQAYGNKEIVVVDDGSHSESKEALREISKLYNITVHYFEQNRGKRHALHHAVKNFIKESDFIVTIDSDTVLDKSALIKIVEPLLDPNVGAASGDVQLLNENQNLLTRMIGAYYWKSLHIHRKAQSGSGMVGCCSGCLAAYKAELILSVIDDFVNQEFFGMKCTYSEDRHLTNLVLKKGHDVVFAPDAISYTTTPYTFRGFLRQQLRWRRGYIRESIFTLSYAWKTKPLLFIQVCFWDLTMPFFSFGLMLAGFFTIISTPLLFATKLLPYLIIFSFIRNFPLVLDAKKKIPGLIIFMFFYEFVLYWQFIYALFTLKNRGWITR